MAQRKLAAARLRGSRSGLQNDIAALEGELEQARTEREVLTNKFQNFDQKHNQLMQMLITMSKVMGERAKLGTGSKSGL